MRRWNAYEHEPESDTAETWTIPAMDIEGHLPPDTRPDYNANLTPENAGIATVGFRLNQLLAKAKETLAAVFANPQKNIPMMAGIALISVASLMVIGGVVKGVRVRKKFSGRRKRRSRR